jgi:hypothetical protein
MVPARTPAFAIAALLAPVVGGAIAAIQASRRAQRELGVDEVAGVGARVGLAGGFIVAVPFPVAFNLYLERESVNAAGLAASIGFGAAVLITFFVLAVVAAVIAARLHAR